MNELRNIPRHTWILLIAAGAFVGYMSQANWGFINHETDGVLRPLTGLFAGGLIYPALVVCAGMLMSSLLHRSLNRVLAAMVPLMVLAALLLAYPDGNLRSNGALGLILLLCALNALLALWLAPRLSGAALLILALLAMNTVGYHDKNTRFLARGSLEKVLKGDADAAQRYRILVPWSAYGVHKLTKVPLDLCGFALRVMLTFICFLVSIRVMARFVEPGMALIAPFLHAVYIPFSYMFKFSTDEAEILGVWLMIWAAAAKKPYHALAVLLFFSLNRETIVLIVPWFTLYFLMLDGWKWRNRIWIPVILMGLGWLALQFVMIYSLGFAHQPGDRINMHNNLVMIQNWLAFVGPERFFRLSELNLDIPLTFCGGAWLAALLYSHRLPLLIRTGLWINVPFVLGLQFVTGVMVESRQIYLLVPFVVSAAILFFAQKQAAT